MSWRQSSHTTDGTPSAQPAGWSWLTVKLLPATLRVQSLGHREENWCRTCMLSFFFPVPFSSPVKLVVTPCRQTRLKANRRGLDSQSIPVHSLKRQEMWMRHIFQFSLFFSCFSLCILTRAKWKQLLYQAVCIRHKSVEHIIRESSEDATNALIRNGQHLVWSLGLWVFHEADIGVRFNCYSCWCVT